ncbi:MAG: double zinc ribbon domain-containing protein [Candidatus Adiutrix sp.]
MSLECENCGHKPATTTCSSCKEKVPSWVTFCPHCGQSVKRKPLSALKGDPMSIENRRACSDGNCIGILDEGGRCVVCGKS